MSNYNSLKATIDANIKQNGNQGITGQILNSVLNQMVTTLGAGYQFAGVATLDPATDPGTPDAKVFYIANGKGTYTNFGGIEVTEDEVVVLYYDTEWHKVSTGIASQKKLSELEIKDNDVIKEIENVKADVVGIQNEIGIPIVFSTSGSGWTDYIDVNAVAGDTILIKSLNYRIDYINYYNDDDNPIKSWEPTDVQVGVETLLTLSIDAKRIKLYAMGATDITLYKQEAIKTSLEDAKQSIDVINGITEFDFKPLRGVSNIMINGDAGHDLKSYSAWRFSYFYYHSGGYIFRLGLEGYRNDQWQRFDRIEWLNGEEHQFNAVDIVKGKLGFFEVYVNWSALKEGSYLAINQEIRKQCIDYALIDEKKSVTNAYLYGDFESKDYIKHTIVVDVNGNGDFTTINDAYLSIKDSGYTNQYEVVVVEGVYNEYNLVPPPFTHTYGIGNVVVTSEGKTGKLPVFDQKKISKLSNLKIVSATGYCIHQDFSGLEGKMLINENLYCKKVYGADVRNHGWASYTNPSILGIGSHKKGAKFVYKNCVFEDGECAAHTIGAGTKYGNQHIVYDGCKFINSYVWLGVAGTNKAEGEYVCEMSNCVTKAGDYAVKLKYGVSVGGNINFPWKVIGAGNKNFSPVFDKTLDTNAGNIWSAVNTDSISFAQLASGVSVTEGQWVDVDGNICTNDTDNTMIHGVVLSSMSADSGEAVRLYIGNAYPYTATDGKYGIGADGKLSLNASKKIGVVKNNIFYRTL